MTIIDMPERKKERGTDQLSEIELRRLANNEREKAKANNTIAEGASRHYQIN
jgi:hypothetical protein